MKKSNIKILNLNLWNYNHWESRKAKIIEFIKKHDPDIVVFQEARDDIKLNKKGDNQAKQLNRELGFPHYAFYSVTDKRKERPEKYKNYCREGTAVLSKFPILKIEKDQLQKHKDDRYTCGNLYVRIKANKIIDLIAVHFSNNNYFSLLHLLETLRYIKKKGIRPIIVGDFNMIGSHVLHEITGDEYKSSLEYKKYLSYPPANYTLDYILIPKKYKFKSLQCTGKDLSDHMALVSEVELR